VDEDDGELVVALEATEEAEELADVGGRVLVAVVEANERVEEEEAGFDGGEGEVEPLLVVGSVEPESGLGDEADGEPLELLDAADVGDGSDALLDGGGRVFGGVEQDGAALTDGVAPEAWLSAGDCDGQLEGEPGLAALGAPADEADGLVGP
jgi:hypothetical protein